MNLLAIAKSGKGHNNNLTGGSWLARHNGIKVARNGKKPFTIPENKHVDVIAGYHAARIGGYKIKYYIELGKKYPSNNAPASY